MNLRTTVWVAALLLCLVAAGCFPPPDNSNSDGNVNRPTPTPTTEVKITYPDDRGLVDQVETVRGTSQNVPAGQRIWVLIYIPTVGRYYPQNDPANVQPDGNWTSAASFGVPKDKGLKFDALVVTADRAAQNDFQIYLKGARDRNDFPGIAQLSSGATERHRITVTRR